MYPLAKNSFEKVINLSPEISQAYFYDALATIAGRRLMTITLNEARQIEAYLKMAIQIDEGQPQYKLLLAMLKRDYYEIHGLRVPPPGVGELLSEIIGAEINKNELTRLRESVKVGKEAQFYNLVKAL